jgi:hypothetical protein
VQQKTVAFSILRRVLFVLASSAVCGFLRHLYVQEQTLAHHIQKWFNSLRNRDLAARFGHSSALIKRNHIYNFGTGGTEIINHQ